MQARTLPPPYVYTPPAPPVWLQALVALGIGFAIFFTGLAFTPPVVEFAYRGYIYPGVHVAGVDLSNLSPAEAERLLLERLDYPQRGRIVLQYGQQVWTAAPSQLGVRLDGRSTAQAAYAVGRSGGFTQRWSAILTAWSEGSSLPPLMVYDERDAQAFLTEIAAQVDIPTIEASLRINGTEVVVTPGQVGRSLDIDGALQAMRPSLQGMTDAVVPLQIEEMPPVILDASQQAEVARRILSAPLTLDVEGRQPGDPGPWSLNPDQLAAWLEIHRVPSPEGERYEVGLNQTLLRQYLDSLSPGFYRLPENARFIFNDDTRQLEVIQPAVIGRALDVNTSLSLVNEKLAAGEHSVALDMEFTNPPVTDDATSASLGITELVSSHTSYFYGSSASRIQNIQTAASRFHGVLVPPGATFSMAEVLGDVSLDNGYAEALIIFGDRTIQGVGGGVCQVSTTLFRTVFLGGFPIVERYPHAYRVGYYEQRAGGGYDESLAGLDATVFVPMVDFKFVNDTPNWLLMETYIDTAGRRLTWKFYSTSDGRVTEWQTSGIQNRVEPPEPLYEENPDLAKDQIKQVDYEAEGADVTITRTVTRNGQTILQDQFYTHYLPWRAVYQYGPGTEIPEQEDDQDE
jgi:vancomycin resistance protein YoaR